LYGKQLNAARKFIAGEFLGACAGVLKHPNVGTLLALIAK
jgi:hypothetical protein